MEWVAVTGLTLLCIGLVLKLRSLWDIETRYTLVLARNKELEIERKSMRNVLKSKEKELQYKEEIIADLAKNVPGGSVALVNKLLQKKCSKGGDQPKAGDPTPNPGDSH